MTTLNSPLLATIQQAVCREFEAPDKVMTAKRGPYHEAKPRHVAIYLERLAGITLGEIAITHHCDHTNVCYVLRAIAAEIEEGSKTGNLLKMRIEKLRNELKL